MFMFNSPLEQFIVLPFFLSSFIPYSSFFIIQLNTVFFAIFSVLLFIFLSIFSLIKSKGSNMYLIPNMLQISLEKFFLAIVSLLQDNIQAVEKNSFVPIVGAKLFFVLALCLFGILPYTYTVTSQLIITLSISLFSFIAIQFIAIKKHKIKFFSTFFPSGVAVPLSILLVPIEFISFFFKPVALSIRLFVNMMGGHTLLKVIAGFAWIILSTGGLVALGCYLPLILLVVLFFLEVAVAVIQSFIFSVLICVYLNEVFNLH